MKHRKFYPALILIFLLFSGWKMLVVSKDKVLVTINKINVYEDTIANAVFFTSGMNIDADGSPRAYHPVADSGSDNLANAGHKGNWWGIVTDKNGEAVVQGKDDPAPGFYVSCTSLQDASKKIIDPARYVNSDSIPYIVLPNNKIVLAKIMMGDIAFVKNLRNGKFSFAICADVGSKDKIGEGSIYLAQQLGIDASPRKGGISDSIFYEVYAGSGNGNPLLRAAIDSIGRQNFKK
ncbi:MAG: glycoside hydrolase family 75 protein [Bacteroidota bacterium]|nr:glycoside hydrolase family 75 protein [Bacteroidota bacterium]